LARLSRHELKEDKIRSTFEEYEHFAKAHYREIALVVGMAVVIVGLVVGLKYLIGQRESTANAQLGEALETFHAYVGTAAPGTLGPQAQSFPTAHEKYTKALAQFSAMTNVTGMQKLLPEQKAVRVARYHVGLCQAQLGDQAGAIKTLTQAGADSDPQIGSLARFALAGELVTSGKTPDGVKIFQDLVDHPTDTVPKATSQMALADALRATQPAQARQLYERMQKEYATDSMLAESIKQQLATLPK
jgi:hypothetical protein